MGNAENNAISILIADDHFMVRDAVSTLLSMERDLVVSVAGDLAAVKDMILRNSSYDIVMLDVMMPGMNGLDSVKSVVEVNADGNVVVFSGNVTSDFVFDAIKIGARGYIPKTMPLKALPSALRLITSGQTFLPMSLMVGAKDVSMAQSPDKMPALTEKETTVLRFVAMGKPNKEIAWEMHLSEVTVKMHMRSIFAKLDANNRTHAVMIARARNLV